MKKTRSIDDMSITESIEINGQKVVTIFNSDAVRGRVVVGFHLPSSVDTGIEKLRSDFRGLIAKAFRLDADDIYDSNENIAKIEFSIPDYAFSNVINRVDF